MKKLIAAFMLCTSTTLVIACGKKSENMQKVPDNGAQRTESVGPFPITVPTDGSLFEHEFQIRVAQEGAVSYIISQPTDTSIELVDTDTSVAGCDPTKVEVTAWFFPDENRQEAFLVWELSRFQVLHNKKSKLVINFANLEGCTEIAFRLQLRSAD